MSRATAPFLACCLAAARQQLPQQQKKVIVTPSTSRIAAAPRHPPTSFGGQRYLHASSVASTSSSSPVHSTSAFPPPPPSSSPAGTTTSDQEISESGLRATYHQPDPQRVAEHLNSLLEGLSPPISPEMAMRMVTHKGAISPGAPAHLSQHNSRLSFLGRRVLRLYLSIFYQAHAGILAEAERKSGYTPWTLQRTGGTAKRWSEESIEDILTTYSLGQYVAPRWELEGNMHWRQMIGRDGRPTGLQKISGETVEAILGCIYRQYGAAIALKVFNSRILPFLPLPTELKNPAVQLAKSHSDLR